MRTADQILGLVVRSVVLSTVFAGCGSRKPPTAGVPERDLQTELTGESTAGAEERSVSNEPVREFVIDSGPFFHRDPTPIWSDKSHYLQVRAYSLSWSSDERFMAFDATYEPQDPGVLPVEPPSELCPGKRRLYIAEVASKRFEGIDLPAWDCRDPKYAPTTRTIAFMAKDEAHAGLWTIDQDTRVKKQIVANSEMRVFTWATDDRIVYLVSSEAEGQDAIWKVEMRTLKRDIVVARPRPQGKYVGIVGFAISPSGTNIAVTVPEWPDEDNLWLSPIDRPDWTRVKTAKGRGAAGVPACCWLSDERTVLFRKHRGRGGGLALWTAGFGRTTPRLAPIPNSMFVTSRDGRKVLWATGAWHRWDEVGIWDSETSKIRMIPLYLSPKGFRLQSWSPRGNWLVVRGVHAQGLRCYPLKGATGSSP